MTSFGSSDLSEEWLSWACNTTDDSNLFERQQALQYDYSILGQTQKSNEQPEEWGQQHLRPNTAFSELPSYDGGLEPYSFVSSNQVPEQDTPNNDRAHGSLQPKLSPRIVPISTFTSSATVSPDIMSSPKDSTPVSSFMDATTRDDPTHSELLDEAFSEQSLSHSSTPPSSLSPDQVPPKRRGKRKSITEIQDDNPKHEAQKQRIMQAAGHSVCEKRYRTKLNVKLAALRSIVPSLQDISKQSEAYTYQKGTQDLDPPLASTKFDKATIISKAIEYITYLEDYNNSLSGENKALEDRMLAVQEISMAGPSK